jgi:hypothetical protein
MRLVGEIPHPDCKITLFNWNNRYLVKLEKGLLEQTYKINQFDLASEDELFEVVNQEFIHDVIRQFDTMEAAWRKALQDS